MARRRGMTLIELLVVVSILLMLALIAIPAVRPGLEGQRTREAARMVNVFISNARNRAEATGRPYGVEIERLKGMLLACAVLYQVEVPPPYAGDFQNSRIIIGTGGQVSFSPDQGEAPYDAKLIQPGDSLKLNYQGHVWSILSTGRSGSRVWTCVSTTTSSPPTTPPEGLPFQIFRQAVRTSVAPLQLPRGTVIDLTYSGTTTFFQPSTFKDPHTNTWVINNMGKATITFSPNGAVDRLYGSDFGSVRGMEPIYLLVGRRTRVPTNLSVQQTGPNEGALLIDGKYAPKWPPPLLPQPPSEWWGPSPAEDLLTNLEDLGNFWITIQAQTGLATTADVAAGAPDIALAREEAAKGRPVGGR